MKLYKRRAYTIGERFDCETVLVPPALLRYDDRPPRIRVGDHEVRVESLTYTADDLKLLLD
jgi:hypothetical protein